MEPVEPLAASAAKGPTYGSTAPSLQTMTESVGSTLPPDHALETRLFPNLLSSLLCMVFPCSMLGSVKMLAPQEQAAVLWFGEYHGTIQEPGLYFMNSCGLQLMRISTKLQTLQLKDLKVLDARGNPVIISGVVTFFGTSAKKATLEVDRPWPGPGHSQDTFLDLQATAVLKRVASQFPYEAPKGEASLQTEGAMIAQVLRNALQEKVVPTGAYVVSFDLVDLSYAPEIAQMMLVRQSADALVDARRSIVTAAVDMTKDAVQNLRESAQGVDEKTCQTITSNLLTVICSQASVTPTVSMATP